VLGFSFGFDKAIALSSLILNFAFSSALNTFFGLPFAFGLAAAFFFGFFAALLVFGLADVARVVAAVANVRRSVKEKPDESTALSVLSSVLSCCMLQML
jgi:hypothetical protein